MKSFFRSTVVNTSLAAVLIGASALPLHAGNEDRIGQAGASELLINPWARSSGWAGANTASAVGLEAMHLNVAGLAFTNKTELLFTRTSWLVGSEVNINSFGFTQRVGEQAVLGMGIMAMDFGDIPITTVNQPEGGIGSFSPQYLNMGISYAREFSNSIFGGITVKTISESIADASARGVCFDAGIRYVTGEQDHVKFGIALRNVGPKMQYTGDGFATKVDLDDEQFTLEQRTEAFELPSILSIGGSYDFFIGAKADSTGEGISSNHRITAAGNFMSNSFGKDQVQVGVEYGFKSYFMVRAGYVYEKGMTDLATRTTAYTGPTVGGTVSIPMGQNGASISLDYSYRTSNPFRGTHAIGARIHI